MPFVQFKIDKSVEQCRGIFDKYLYRPNNGDERADILEPGYFNRCRYVSDPDWVGSILEVQAADVFFIAKVTEPGTIVDLLVSGGTGGDTPPPSMILVNKLSPQSIPPESATTIEYDRIVLNDGAQYSTFDHSATVAQTGYYIFSASVATIGGWTANETQVLEVHVNDVLAKNGYIGRDTKEVNSGVEYDITQSHGCIPLNLNAGDKVKAKIYHDRGIALPLVTNQAQSDGQLNYFSLLKVSQPIETGTGTSKTEFFNNKTEVVVEFEDGSYPVIDVYTYDSEQDVPDLQLIVNDTGFGGMSGYYNNIGNLSVDNSGLWAVDLDHHLFKHETLNKYIAYRQGVESWIIFNSINDHNNLGGLAEDFYNSLNGGSLPGSFGAFEIESNISTIDTQLMVHSSPGYKLDRLGSKVTLSFGDTPQTGILIYK
tara:strand:+ start:10565 stop:11845 length:1281 start_codon:yes stop_codon:yes gene_type:complete